MQGKRKAHQAAFIIRFVRPTHRMLISVFMPPLAIMILNQAVLFLHVEASETRLSMCSSALLSSVMYHITINSNTPSTATETTRADCFMFLCYLQNVLIWFIVLFMYVVDKSRFLQVAEWVRTSLHYHSRIALPLDSATFVILILSLDSAAFVGRLVPMYAMNVFVLSLLAIVDYL